MKDKITEYKLRCEAIEQWPVRARKAGLTHKRLAKLAGVSDITFSRIINFKVGNPHLTTRTAIEKVLTEHNV